MVIYPVDLSRGITESFFENIQELADKKIVVTKRLTDVALELLQNIKKHAIAGTGTLSIKKYNSHFLIEACNPVHPENVGALKSKINHINKLDYTQLKKAHSQTLCEARLSEKTGAGLGLYRIAIRTKSALKASFISTNQDHSIFTLHVNLAI